MGWEWLLGSGGSETTTKAPKWVNKASKAAVELGTDLASRPYTPYGYQRIADFSGDQKDAMGMLRRGADSISPTAGKLTPMRRFNPMSNIGDIDMVRLIDRVPGGQGGTIEDYQNPYVDNVLDRTRQRIRQATNYARKWQSDTEANMAGAYGDSRHGVADFLLQKEGMQQEGDAAAQAYAESYNNAQQLRDADINRWLDLKQQNIQNGITQKEFNNAGYLDWENLNTQRHLGQQQANSQAQSDFLRYIDSLFRSGQQQQGLDQKNMDLMYQDFQNQRDYPLQQYDLLLRALNGTPSSNNRTVTTSDDGNWLNDIMAGALGIGAILPQL